MPKLCGHYWRMEDGEVVDGKVAAECMHAVTDLCSGETLRVWSVAGADTNKVRALADQMLSLPIPWQRRTSHVRSRRLRAMVSWRITTPPSPRRSSNGEGTGCKCRGLMKDGRQRYGTSVCYGASSS